MDMSFDWRRGTAGQSKACPDQRGDAQKIVRDDSNEWIGIRPNDH
jgi:hypothetical protein